MSASSSFPLNNDQNGDRPISVYDNLSSSPTILNGHRESPRQQTTNGDPLRNISFKFDYGIGNGVPLHSTTSVPETKSIKPDLNSTSPNKAMGPLIGSTATPEVNCNVGVKTSLGSTTMSPTAIAAAAASAVTLTTQTPITLAASTTKTTPDRDQVVVNKSSPRSPAFSVMSELARNDRYGGGSNKTPAVSEATFSQKPVISDAKSKFFGLTTPTNSDNATGAIDDHRQSKSVIVPYVEQPLIDNDRHQSITILPSTVQANAVVVSSPDHKYQNIPPNSAIFRKAMIADSVNSRDMSDSVVPLVMRADRGRQDDHDEYDDEEIFLSEKRPNSNLSTTDSRNDRRRNTNSFHADMDLNFAQQQPSQVIYMTTTVPQNIKSPNIAGRHTPTRNSLRHSRMLVINKNYQGLTPANPLGLRHPRLARTLLMFLLMLGILITAVGIWILLWAPYTRMQDNPYWSGLSLILAGTLGLIVLKFKRIKRQKLREHCFTFLKVDSLMLTLIACILCLAAFSCASLHLHNLYSTNTKCASTNRFIANASCVCIFGAQDKNFTLPSENVMGNETENVFSGGYEFYYRDLSCNEVNGAWRYLLVISVVLNILGFFFGSCYLLLSCFKTTDKRKAYNSVRTNVF